MPKTLSWDSVAGTRWRKLACSQSRQLNLAVVLMCGQSFRWSSGADGEFVGVLDGKVWTLKQDEDHLYYKTVSGSDEKCDRDAEESFLLDYFQLGVDLDKLYASWEAADPIFGKVSRDLGGVRILKQDPVENIFSFICSSNNNIRRISAMVEKLCVAYGDPVVSIPDSSTTFYSFPSLQQLATSANIESQLRSFGFGYRAGYVAKTARQLVKSGGEPYLRELKKMPYGEAKKELLKLAGVGPKVADCILLMSLNQPSAIPVDIHMFNVAKAHYLPHLANRKTVTDRIYGEIGDHFRALYGDYAGWAQSVLFSSDLRRVKTNAGDVETKD